MHALASVSVIGATLICILVMFAVVYYEDRT